ncbi:hypothetical protein Leryth_007641 [Lithospermum erythrorhizon]|nr:hypothetical protein Leryth_007641 [Lithospermum erythrorhizon]
MIKLLSACEIVLEADCDAGMKLIVHFYLKNEGNLDGSGLVSPLYATSFSQRQNSRAFHPK